MEVMYDSSESLEIWKSHIGRQKPSTIRKAEPCRALKGPCPFGDSPHFDNKAEALAYADEVNASKEGVMKFSTPKKHNIKINEALDELDHLGYNPHGEDGEYIMEVEPGLHIITRIDPVT